MKIVLDLIENKFPCTIKELVSRIYENLVEEQGLPILKRQMSDIRNFVISCPQRGVDISQLYSTITNAGYSIKTSKITT